MAKYLAVLVAGLVLAAGIGMYLFFKPHEDISEKLPDFSLSAPALFAEFEADEAAANAKYLDKLIAVNGVLASVEGAPESNLVVFLAGQSELGGGVSCAFEPADAPASLPAPGKEVRIKGWCTGVLTDVSLSRCVLLP